MSPALIGLLLDLIPPIIQGVELAFSNKPKSGADKMRAVVGSVGQIAEVMLTAGVPLPDGSQIPDQSVDDKVVRGLAEAAFQRLKATGQLSATASVPNSGLFVVRGTVTPIPA